MPAGSIRVFLIDDNVLYRDSAVAVLSPEKDIEVVGQGSSVEQAKPRLAECKPDVVLCELALPGRAALNLLREVPSLSPASRTIAISDDAAEADIVEAMRLGARGFLDKQCPVALFRKCIRKVHAGEIWLNGRLTEAVLRSFASRQAPGQLGGEAKLSRREMEVIQLVTQGCKNRDIARKLFISEKTVKNHLSAVFRKLGVADRLELTRYALERRWFPPE